MEKRTFQISVLYLLIFSLTYAQERHFEDHELVYPQNSHNNDDTVFSQSVIKNDLVYLEGLTQDDKVVSNDLPEKRMVTFDCPAGMKLQETCDYLCRLDPFIHLENCPEGCFPLFEKPPYCGNRRDCDCGGGRMPFQNCVNDGSEEVCEWQCSISGNSDAFFHSIMSPSNNEERSKCGRWCRNIRSGDPPRMMPEPPVSLLGRMYIRVPQREGVQKNEICWDRKAPIERCSTKCL